MSQQLEGRVAVVTGASRGIGKGIAVELGASGATVYVTGRTTSEGGILPGTVGQTAKEIVEFVPHASQRAADGGQLAHRGPSFVPPPRLADRRESLL